MKKTFQIIGIIAVGLTALILALILFFAPKAVREYQSVKTQFQQTITPLTQTWNINQLLKEASPELQKVLTENQKDSINLFKIFKEHLGPLKSLNKPQGEIQWLNNQMTAKMKAEAQFEKSSGTIYTHWVKLPSKNPEEIAWKIQYFHIESPAFKLKKRIEITQPSDET